MRTRIAIGFLVLALGAAGKAYWHTPQRAPAASVVAPEVAAPEVPAPAASARPQASSTALPLFEVGPEDEEVKQPGSEPPTASPALDEIKPSAGPPVSKSSDTDATQYRDFLEVMVEDELPALRRCYQEARRLYPRLRPDFRLVLTLAGGPDSDGKLESTQIETTGYRPPDFEKCVQQVVAGISLPSLDGKGAVTLPISVDPADQDGDDDENQDGDDQA